MKLLALLARRARGALLGAVFCGVLGGATNIVFLALVNEKIANAGPSSTGLVLGFVGTAVAMLLSYFVSRLLLVKLLHRTVHDLRERLCREILTASLPRIEVAGAPRMLAFLTEDSTAITAALALTPSLCINAVIVAGTLVYLGALSPLLLGLLVVLLVAVVVAYAVLDGRASDALRAARVAMDGLAEDFDGLIRGNRELKLNRSRRQALVSGHLLPHLAEVRDKNSRGGALYALATSWAQSVTVLLIGMVLFVVPRFQAFEAHVLSGYALGIIQLIGAIGAILEALPAFRRAQIAMDKVEQLQLDLHEKETPAPARSAASRAWSRLDLSGITYTVGRDKDSPFQLGPIDLCLRPGEIVFITGGNGSGKTTLAKIIAGLYTPASGEIRIDGEPIGEGDWDDYRQLFSVSFTDGHLFRPLLGLDEERVREQLERFELRPWVHVADGAFSTTSLSQGQRKRLLLTVALVEDRPFYIFDEWTANQDPPFRERFYREFLPELKALGKAVVVITHDDRYDHVADSVIRLDNGTIREARAISDHDGVRVWPSA